MPKITVEIPQHLLDDMDCHVGPGKKFVNRSDAIRTAIRKMLDLMDRIDEKHGRVVIRDKKERDENGET
ncbi:MAG: ribbon-helix-helix domain-containing protein [Archaeoglobaceae archaeon]